MSAGGMGETSKSTLNTLDAWNKGRQVCTPRLKSPPLEIPPPQGGNRHLDNSFF